MIVGLPPRNPLFTGREDLLLRVHDRLREERLLALGEAAVPRLGGVGKSELAREYAHRFGAAYRHVLWLEMGEVTSAAAAELALARELGALPADAGPDAAWPALKTWLAQDEGWLLILDDARHPRMVRAYLPEAGSSGRVLLTTRTQDLTPLPLGPPLRVGPFALDEAVAFLQLRSGRSEPAAAAELAGVVGCQPHALFTAAASVAAMGVSLEEYLALVQRRQRELLARPPADPRAPVAGAVAASLALSHLHATQPATADLLRAAAFFPAEGVPLEPFTLGAWNLGTRLGPALADADENLQTFWDLWAPLASFGLADRLADGAFVLRWQVRDAVRADLGEEERRSWAERSVLALHAAHPDPEEAEEAEFAALCARLQPSVRAASGLVHGSGLVSAKAVELFHAASNFARSAEGGEFDADLFDACTLELCERVWGPDHDNTLNAATNQARSRAALGDLADARALESRVLTARERLDGEQSPVTTRAAWDLLLTLRELGDAPAEALVREKLRWLRESPEESLADRSQRWIRAELLALEAEG